MSLHPYSKVFAAVVLGRFEKVMSWVFMISLTASGDETTKARVCPNCNNIREPCFCERVLREWYGNLLSWWRLPMIGSFLGEGGRLKLGLILGLLVSFNTTITRRKRKRYWWKVETEKAVLSCSYGHCIEAIL